MGRIIHRSRHRFGRAFSPHLRTRRPTQGVALGWYGGGPLALGSRHRRTPSRAYPRAHASSHPHIRMRQRHTHRAVSTRQRRTPIDWYTRANGASYTSPGQRPGSAPTHISRANGPTYPASRGPSNLPTSPSRIMEITTDLPLDVKEETLLDVHSILNLMNVATHGLLNLGRLSGDAAGIDEAIERNSHGAYRIVNNIAEHEAVDCFVNFEIGSVLGDHLHMPAVFQDVTRDLIANARKYTPPGGSILADLFYGATVLRFTVSDTGVGMAPGEIANPVQLGRRGSNVADRPTRGGGFGLTKAYHVTRRFDGRMWIESEGTPGRGSQIRIELPLPQGGDPRAPTKG